MERNLAIVIGIDHYKDQEVSDLKCAVSDAQLMKEFLSNHAKFEKILLFDSSNNPEEHKPTYHRLATLLTRDELAPNRIGSYDRIWFYFAGHGISRERKAFLLPCDSLWDDPNTRLSVDKVIAALKQHETADITLILDCCRNQEQGRRGFTRIDMEETTKLAKQSQITIIFACSHGEYSHELLKQGHGSGHGSFTYALVEGLERHTLPKPLENYLRKRVSELNKMHGIGAKQTPSIEVDTLSKLNDSLLPSHCTTAADRQALELSAQNMQVPNIARRRWLKTVGFIGIGIGSSVGATLLTESLLQPKTRSPSEPRSTPEPQSVVPQPSKSQPSETAPSSPNSPAPAVVATASFAFSTVTLDAAGQEIDRHTREAKGFLETIAEGINLEMVGIPAGTFEMGSPASEAGRDSTAESPQRIVEVPSFAIGRYPLTQAQWRVVANLPAVRRSLKTEPSHFKGDNRPVETLSWLDATEFCERLTRKTGRSYRLPSEAEWEYACRAGTKTPFSFGAVLTPQLANYSHPLIGETTPVGYFGVANAFGLYDMHGNIWEYCADHWLKDYIGAPHDSRVRTDPAANYARVIRGGSWLNLWQSCRSASRHWTVENVIELNLGLGGSNFGMRVVCTSM